MFERAKLGFIRHILSISFQISELLKTFTKNCEMSQEGEGLEKCQKNVTYYFNVPKGQST